MVTYHSVTQAGLDALKQEVVTLQQTRPKRIAALAAARALGDLSENAEYSAAKRDLRHLESRLRYLDKLIRYAQVVTPTEAAVVQIGLTVTLTFLDDGEVVTYQVVGPAEARLAPTHLASNSPLGQALMKQPVGQVVTVSAPAGDYQVRIDSITR